MNRKQKIIVSVVGITIVLLALLGITYAYYLTRIEGNTNTNSISITTADLKLEYGDGNGLIEASGVMPGDSIIKTFTVENTGENKVTGYTIVIEDVVNELSRRDDLKYSLYCKYDDGTSCGESNDNFYPKTSNISIIYANDIDSRVKHNYELIINYIYLDDIDQSDDMGSTISGKVNIYDTKDEKLNPFSTGVTATDNNNLAYNIIENARLGKNGTSLTGTTLTTVAEEVSSETESVLAITQDDYGTSYYFRGNVVDNYVNFADMCWKIVRISGDGSVKLILESSTTLCNDTTDNDINNDGYYNEGSWSYPLTESQMPYANFGYEEIKYTDNSGYGNVIINYLNPNSESKPESMSYALENFQNSKLSSYYDKIKTGGWCLADAGYSTSNANVLNDTLLTESEKNARYSSGNWNTDGYYPENVESVYYDTYVRFNNATKYPTIKCNGTLMDKFSDSVDMKVGTLTANEVIYAGGMNDKENSYYLINDYSHSIDTSWWTLSPGFFGGGTHMTFNYYVSYTGEVDISMSTFNQANYEKYIRPAISLVEGITITSGEGTLEKPYVIG